MVFEDKVLRYFTAVDLVDYLNVDVETVFDRFEDEIYDRYEEICEEMGYEPEDDEDIPF